MIRISAILIAGVVFVTGSVKAANVSTSPGDVILGFRVTGGTGAGTDYLVDLGSYSSFVNVSGTINLSSDLSAADLSNTFGTSWNTRTDLLWSVFAANNTGVTLNGALYRTVFGTFDSNGNAGMSNASGAPYQSDIAGNQGPAASNIAGVQSVLGQTAQASTTHAALISSSISGSYTTNGVTGKSVMFANSNNSSWPAPGDNGFENDANVLGHGSHTSDFYESVPASGLPDASLLGYFSLSSTGSSNETFTFTGLAQVPEPSTFSLALIGALGTGAIVYRRRKA